MGSLQQRYQQRDGWQHEVLLEKVLLGEESFEQICVAGKGCCPPEDSGGPQGFTELLKALDDANHPNHEDACEWLGDFDPESFSSDEINRRLRHRKH
jgi:hypothetical protein